MVTSELSACTCEGYQFELSITFFTSSSRCKPAEHVVQTVLRRFLTRPGLLRAASGAAPARHKRQLAHGHSPSIQRRPTNQIIEAPSKTARAEEPPKSSKPTRASHNRVIHPENSNTASSPHKSNHLNFKGGTQKINRLVAQIGSKRHEFTDPDPIRTCDCVRRSSKEPLTRTRRGCSGRRSA